MAYGHWKLVVCIDSVYSLEWLCICILFISGVGTRKVKEQLKLGSEEVGKKIHPCLYML